MKDKKNEQNFRVTAYSLLGVCLTVLCSVLLIFSACNQPTDNPTDKNISVSRFIATPDNSIGEDKIKYSYTYNGYDFYYVYLGELKNIPVYFQTAQYHSGIDWTYTFSTTNTTTESIRSVVTENSQTVIGVVESYTNSKTTGGKLGDELSAKAGVGIKPIFSADVSKKVNGELNWSKYISESDTFSTQMTTSLTETTERTTSYTWSSMESNQFRLTRSDKIGYYRYTLFQTSDVYLYVIRDSQTEEIYYEFREYVKPNVYFWRLDYSETPSFDKSDATSFVLDISILDNLPETKVFFDYVVPSYIVEYNSNGGGGTMLPVAYEIGTEHTLSYNTFTSPTGYSFAGWAKSSAATSAEFTDGQTVLNLTEESGARITLYAVWRSIKQETERRVFTAAGSGAYIFNKGFPATIEVYALGAGGGGQGGHYSDVISTFGAKSSTGTGGAGGGGAATYVKFSVVEPVTFTITVGRGGIGGTGVSRSNTQEWRSGNPGASGGNTTVSWGTNTLTARGGSGGGGSEQILTGGSGGTANTVWPPGILASFSLAGGKGTNGTRGHGGGGDIESRGGNAASISIGSETLFGGGSGAIRLSGHRPESADIGGGGSGDYNSSRSGSSGGDGHVIIVVTYYE